MSHNDDPHLAVGAYVLHSLPPSEEAAFEDHLAGCATCRHEADELAAVTARLGAAEAIA
jgi:anti-sigma factor RsiW